MTAMNNVHLNITVSQARERMACVAAASLGVMLIVAAFQHKGGAHQQAADAVVATVLAPQRVAAPQPARAPDTRWEAGGQGLVLAQSIEPALTAASGVPGATSLKTAGGTSHEDPVVTVEAPRSPVSPPAMASAHVVTPVVIVDAPKAREPRRAPAAVTGSEVRHPLRSVVAALPRPVATVPSNTIEAVNVQVPAVQEVRVGAPPDSAVAQASGSQRDTAAHGAPAAIGLRSDASQVEAVSQSQAQVQSLAAGSVTMRNGQIIRVGERFPSGETLIRVDTAMHQIATDRRTVVLMP
jgi:hypothetical protein